MTRCRRGEALPNASMIRRADISTYRMAAEIATPPPPGDIVLEPPEVFETLPPDRRATLPREFSEFLGSLAGRSLSSRDIAAELGLSPAQGEAILRANLALFEPAESPALSAYRIADGSARHRVDADRNGVIGAHGKLGSVVGSGEVLTSDTGNID